MAEAAHNLSEETFAERYFDEVRSLGRLALSGNSEELQDYEQRRYDELTSGLTEALQGIVSTHYPFELEDGHLVAEDGEPIQRMLNRAHDNDLEQAEHDKFYAQFLPQRSAHELNELLEQEAMARGEADFNTIITFSPYNQEFDTSPQNHKKLQEAKQKPQWKRAMVRFSHWDGQKLHIATRSIDNSDLALLHETAKRYFGYKFEATDSTGTLGERIHLNVDTKMAALMPDGVTRVADSILTERLGGVWQQGRSQEEARDLQKFVESNAQIVNQLLDTGQQLAHRYSNFEDYKQAYDNEIYNHAALLEFRLERGATEVIVDVAAASAGAGSLARADGRSYDMCGYILNGDSTESETAKQTGFESLLRLVGKELSCPECKQKVIVPSKDLKDGHLSCSECGYDLDVCTGQKKWHGKKPNAKPNSWIDDALDDIKIDWERSKQAAELKRARQKNRTD